VAIMEAYTARFWQFFRKIILLYFKACLLDFGKFF